MNIAFHFDIEAIKANYSGLPYNIPILDRIFSSLLTANLDNIHLKVFGGNLLRGYAEITSRTGSIV